MGIYACGKLTATYSKRKIYGTELFAKEIILLRNIEQIDTAMYNEARLVIKGCGELPIGESAYVAITQKLRPIAKSIMYGEPCSMVPVYKRKAAAPPILPGGEGNV